MNAAEYAACLKKGEVCGGYLFYGEEQYLILRYLEQTRSAFFADESEAAFNHFRLRAQDCTPERVMDAMQALPMMGERKLIEIEGLSLDGMGDSDREAYLSVFSLLPEYEYNTLILVATPNELSPGTPKKPSQTIPIFEKALRPVLFEKQTQAKLNKWLGQHFAAWGLFASPQACTFLIEYAGEDMFTLSAQAEKLCCYLLSKGKTQLEQQDILTVACSANEYDTFAMENALMAGDCDTALAVLRDRQIKKDRPEILLGSIAAVYQKALRIEVMASDGMTNAEIQAKTKYSPFLVEKYRRAISGWKEGSVKASLALCADADLKIKNGRQDPYLVLQMLLMETIACRRG